MTTTDDLVALVERDPHNPICEGMLYDHLYGDIGMTHSEATARVRTVVETARSARQIREATVLLRSDAATRREAILMIYAHCGIPVGAAPTVIVTDGVVVHVGHSGSPDSHESYWGHTVISVGAHWLLSQWKEHVRTLPGHRGSGGRRYRRR